MLCYFAVAWLNNYASVIFSAALIVNVSNEAVVVSTPVNLINWSPAPTPSTPLEMKA